MKKVKRFILNDSTLQLSASQMRELKGGDSNDYFYSVCSCNNIVGTWHGYCHVDLLGKDQYSAVDCRGYYRCAAV